MNCGLLLGPKFYRLWALVYVEGGFRFVGDLHPPDFRGSPAKLAGPTDSPDSSNEPEKRVRMGNAIAAKLARKVQP